LIAGVLLPDQAVRISQFGNVGTVASRLTVFLDGPVADRPLIAVRIGEALAEPARTTVSSADGVVGGVGVVGVVGSGLVEVPSPGQLVPFQRHHSPDAFSCQTVPPT
jgi:hypothetical protein